MAIRKDLDDMLNNLKQGSAPKKAAQPEKKTGTPVKKSVYDSMSVDDILSALKEEKKPGLAENIINELDEKKAVKEAEQTKKTEKNKSVQQPEEIMAAPKKKKKKIVISGELPDYEAIRQKELEKLELEKKRNAPEPEPVVIPEPVVEPEPVVIPEPEPVIEPEPVFIPEPEPVIEPEPVVIPEPEPVIEPEPIVIHEPEPEIVPEPFDEPEPEDVSETEAVPVSADVTIDELKKDDEEEPVAEKKEKPKKGFFSKLRKKHEEEIVEADIPEEEEPRYNDVVPEDIPEDENVKIDDLFNIEEQPEEDVQPDENEEPQISEDAPVAIENEELDGDVFGISEESIETIKIIDSALDAIKENQQLAEAEAETESQDEAADSVEEMIDGIRENAANAIAEIEEGISDNDELQNTEEEADSEPEMPKKHNKITSALNSILDESSEELIAVKNEKTEDDEKPKEKGKFKKRLYTVFGVLFTIFAVIGVAATAMKSAQLIKSFTSGEVKKDGFTEIIYPVVIMDIESFDSPSELTSEQIITASIWSIIMNDEKISKYELNPGGDTVSISTVDVEKEAVELFGENLPEFEHTTLGPVESRFYFDTERGAYNVKVNPIVFTYQPEIKTIVKNGSDYVVTVDYIDEMPAWMDKSVSKSVEINITEKNDGTYRINSMKILYVKSSNI